MRELTEQLRQTILAAIPRDNLVLCYAPLRGANPTIADRVLAANNGTFTNPGWKTLKNGLVVPSFDGTAYVKNTTADWRSGDSQGAIGLFFRPTDPTTNRALFSSSDQAGASYYFYLRMLTAGYLAVGQRNGDTLDVVRGGTVLTTGRCYSAFLTSNGSAYAILLNGVPETLTVTSGANNGDWFADTTQRDNFMVGTRQMSSFTDFWVGQIPLCVVYSISPTTAQILQMHNRLNEVFR